MKWSRSAEFCAWLAAERFKECRGDLADFDNALLSCFFHACVQGVCRIRGLEQAVMLGWLSRCDCLCCAAVQVHKEGSGCQSGACVEKKKGIVNA